MKISLRNDNNRNRRGVWLLVLAAVAVIGLCLIVFLIIRAAPLQGLSQLISPSAKPTQVASGPAATDTPVVVFVVATPVPPSPTVPPPPSPTPAPSLTSTPSRTATLTRTPTNTPTPDPWVSLGRWKAGCGTEETFDPVSASRFKFQVLAGGGDDNTISFYCCGSSGAAWLVNEVWVPVTNQSPTLKIGETRETVDFGPAIVNRQRFNVGCNDNEQIDVSVSYLPAPTATVTATATLTTTATITATATLTSTSALTMTATLTPTAVLTPTATITPTTTSPITPTVPLSPTTTLTITPTATTVAPTRPPAPRGSIAYRRNDSGIDRAFIVNLADNTITPLVDVGSVMDLAMSTNAHFGAWSPDNSQFAYVATGSPGASNVLRVLDFKSNANRALFASDPGGGLSSPTWSPDGMRIAFVRLTGNQRLWAIDVVNVDGTRCSDQFLCEITTNTLGEQFRGGLDWSKSGLFALALNTTGANEIYTLFSNGNGRANLTNNPADDSTPTWSPDGKLIAFTSNRDGRPQIYVMNADGSNLRRVSQGDAGDVSPTWSPDGNWIAFTSNRDGSTDIYMMDLSGGNTTRLTKTGGDHPIWSH